METPSLSLVDFARVSIPAGGSARVTLRLTPRDMAVLSDPRCSVVPQSADTQLAGTPFKVIEAGQGVDAAGCCAACGALERCEAFTLTPRGACEYPPEH